MVAPNERSLWNRAEASDSKGRTVDRIAALYMLPCEIGAADGTVLCYREANGQSLSRIYAERTRSYRAARGGLGTRRFCLGTITGESDGSQLLHLWKTSGFNFGLGAAVAGIRLDVRLKEEAIRSWDDFELELTLVNATASDSVPMQLSPTLALFQNVSLGISGADSQDSRELFEKWYIEAERHNSGMMPVPSWIQSGARSHQVGILKPGDSQRYALRIPASDSVPRPTGRFQLFVEYDPNLEPDPFEAVLPCWRHRIASRAFNVTVGSNESEPGEK